MRVQSPIRYPWPRSLKEARHVLTRRPLWHPTRILSWFIAKDEYRFKQHSSIESLAKERKCSSHLRHAQLSKHGIVLWYEQVKLMRKVQHLNTSLRTTQIWLVHYFFFLVYATRLAQQTTGDWGKNGCLWIHSPYLLCI